MLENGSEEALLLVSAEPLELAEAVCHRMVDVVRAMDGTLLLGADPVWAGAINTVRRSGSKVLNCSQMGSMS